jgi:hypothetical protein
VQQHNTAGKLSSFLQSRGTSTRMAAAGAPAPVVAVAPPTPLFSLVPAAAGADPALSASYGSTIPVDVADSTGLKRMTPFLSWSTSTTPALATLGYSSVSLLSLEALALPVASLQPGALLLKPLLTMLGVAAVQRILLAFLLIKKDAFPFLSYAHFAEEASRHKAVLGVQGQVTPAEFMELEEVDVGDLPATAKFLFFLHWGDLHTPQ